VWTSFSSSPDCHQLCFLFLLLQVPSVLGP
jgi:hypothetical protein